MKVWWVFAWDNYFPYSELDDLHSTYATEEEAKTAVYALKANASYSNGAYDNVTYLNVSEHL